MRWMITCGIIAVVLASPGMADLVPIDPHVMLGTGGDATDITTAGQPIILSNPAGTDTAGGIFVFHNATGSPLSALDIAIQFPGDLILSVGGISALSLGPGTLFQSTPMPGETCAGEPSTTVSCEQMEFSKIPGPLIGVDQNFIIDFDKFPYTVVADELVFQGNYDIQHCGDSCTGTTDTSDARVGEWPNGATGFVTPVLPTPEPRYYAVLAGALALGAYFRRRMIRTS